ncbi:hypothetical protein BH10BAC2_BH10BAC2_17380 [soil metagenome]
MPDMCSETLPSKILTARYTNYIIFHGKAEETKTCSSSRQYWRR